MKRIQLDWRAYYKQFSELHGGSPIPLENRLLFRDGWMYSRTSHAGPEYSPPGDPYLLYSMQLTYWRTRLNILIQERAQVLQQYRYLRELQEVKDAPLQTVTAYWDSEDKKQVTLRNTIQFDAIEDELAWMANNIKDCAAELKQLKQQFESTQKAYAHATQ